MQEYYGKQFYEICRNVSKGHSLADDLHSEVVIWIYEKSVKKHLPTINNKVYFFSAVAIKIWNSERFKKAYDHNYKRWGKVANVELTGIEQPIESYNFEKESMLQWIETETMDYKSDNQDEWYRKKLLLLYIEEGSERSLAKKVNIPRPTINKDLKDYITYLRNKYDTTHSKP